MLAEQLAKTYVNKGEGKWSPSSFGCCYRKQFWKRQRRIPSNPTGVSTLKKAKLGTLIHEFVQKWWDGSCVEVKLEDENVKGYVDLITDIVWDIKTVSASEFKKICKAGYNVADERKKNILQTCYYAMKLGKTHFGICFICRDDMEINDEFIFNVNDFRQDVEDELEQLNGIWELGKLPPAFSRSKYGLECTTCDYFDDCRNYEQANI